MASFPFILSSVVRALYAKLSSLERKICVLIVPLFFNGIPDNTAKYVLCTSRFLNISVNFTAVSTFFANNNKPLVSLSIRCTILNFFSLNI